MKTRWVSWGAVVMLAVASAVGAAAAGRVAEVDLGAGTLAVRPLVEVDAVTVAISGPDGSVLKRTFGRGEAAVVSLAEGGVPADGAYVYEVRLAPRGSAADGERLSAQRAAEEAGAARREFRELVESGTFTVAGGALVAGGPEARVARAPQAAPKAAGGGGGADAIEDFVIADDLIVQGSTCVGFDCVDGESFGFDTIRLKENNTRIKFEDTSTGTFPSDDWQLTANDSASGGANKFSIENITGARVPFTVLGGAPTNSLFVDGSGRVGLRTATPVLDLHISTSNTPAMRLEQTNAGGFTAQTWDVAGNEANFFVRDVTSGSRLPLRIRPGAPTSSLDISATGLLGVGTASPTKAVHIVRSDGNAQLLVNETNATATLRTLLSFTNNGGVRTVMANTATTQTWAVDNAANNNYEINNIGNAGVEFSMTPTGSITIAGTLTQLSDRNAKDDIASVDDGALLAKVAELPISTWRYKSENVRHLGPMAQDFAAAFGLGADERHIAPADLSGVALAAVKALHAQVKVKDEELAALRRQNDELAQRLAAIEQALAQR